MSGTPTARTYAVFISYRHADNMEQGRQWAKWLHEALERYDVPTTLIGALNLRGDPVPASLYPVFRDEEELPADADLTANIRLALENSTLLVVLCSPRAVQSRFVAEEIRYFKELGRSNRILALIIDGEPNASDDPAKKDQFGTGAECFPEPLRLGVPGEDGKIDWKARTEPIAADVRPEGRAVQGWTTENAYRKQLERERRLGHAEIASAVRNYGERLELAKLKIIAGALGTPLGELTRRDEAHQLARSRQRATVLRRWLTVVSVLGVAAIVGGYVALTQKRRALDAEAGTVVQLKETKKQVEKAWLGEGRAWLERGREAKAHGDNLSALLLAGRAAGYAGYGRRDTETPDFEQQFPLLLGGPMKEADTERERISEVKALSDFVKSIHPTMLPLFAQSQPAAVKCVAASPDGLRFAAGLANGEICLLHSATGAVLTTLKVSGKEVLSLAFSPDGARLAAGSANGIQVWDVVTGKQFATIGPQNQPAPCVVFSPDGSKLAAGTDDGTIILWSATGEKLQSLTGHTRTVASLAFSPDGRRLVSGSLDDTAIIWDLAAGSGATLKGHAAKVSSVAFSPGGASVATASWDRTIKLWDAATARETATLAGHTHYVTRVAFSPDGQRLASGGMDQSIKLWDTVTHQVLVSVQGHQPSVDDLALSPDGARLVSGSIDKTVKVWDIAMGPQELVLERNSPIVDTAAFSPDGTMIASGSRGKSVKLWDAFTGSLLITLPVQTPMVKRLAFSPDGARLAVQLGEGTIRLWDATSGKALSALPTSVFSQVFNMNGSGKWEGPAKTAGQQSAEAEAEAWFAAVKGTFSPDQTRKVKFHEGLLWIEKVEGAEPETLDLASRLRAGWVDLPGRAVTSPISARMLESQVTDPAVLEQLRKAIPQLAVKEPALAPMMHLHRDTLAQLAEPSLTFSKRAELEMQLCAQAGQFRAAIAQWQRLTADTATAPPADSPLRRLYLTTLIDAAGQGRILGPEAVGECATQMAQTLTKELMAQPRVALAMMTLMQSLINDSSPELAAPRKTLDRRLYEVAAPEWLEVLHPSR